MASALSGKVGVSIMLQHTNEQDLSTPDDTLNLNQSRTLSNGTAADQSDLLFHDQRTLTAGGNEELAFNDGSLTGSFGAVTFDKLKGLCLRNHSTAGSLKVGGAAATQLGLFDDTTDILVLPPGTTNAPSCFLFEAPQAAGLDVTSNDTLKLENAGHRQLTGLRHHPLGRGLIRFVAVIVFKKGKTDGAQK